ncbi:GTPase [Aureococcus anophagefferens]|nr:GTPase [Aureococcus anophagefferens]
MPERRSSVRRPSADASPAASRPPPAPPTPTGGGAARADKITRIKLLTMGAAESGKSCIVKRYCEGRFITKYIQTVGVDYGVKPVDVDGKKVRINFWDLSGRPEFFEIRDERAAASATERDSFDQLEDWLKESAKFGMPRDLPVAVCANKVDKPRKVSEAEGRQWAASHKYDYFELSASTGANVPDVFECVFKKALAKLNRANV